MKKIIGLLLANFCVLCFAQNLEWKITKDCWGYDFDYKYVKEFKADQIITGRSTYISKKYAEILYFVDTGGYFEKGILVDAEIVIPNNTKDLFDEKILTPILNRNGKTYLDSSTIEVLKLKDWNIVSQYRPNGRAFPELYDNPLWHMRLVQTVIIMYSLNVKASFFITNIYKNNNNYILDVINHYWDIYDTSIPKNKRPESGNERKYKTTLALYPDGDYLDIFYDDSYWLASFVAVEQEFATQFLSLYETNYCDLTNVTFPRRADKNHRIGTTCIVAESLRLRKEESTSSATLHTMKAGTKLKILQLGKQQTIDGITANWVQVEVLDASLKEPLSKSASTSVPKGDVRRTTGWCFGGYLLEQ